MAIWIGRDYSSQMRDVVALVLAQAEGIALTAIQPIPNELAAVGASVDWGSQLSYCDRLADDLVQHGGFESAAAHRIVKNGLEAGAAALLSCIGACRDRRIPLAVLRTIMAHHLIYAAQFVMLREGAGHPVPAIMRCLSVYRDHYAALVVDAFLERRISTQPDREFRSKIADLITEVCRTAAVPLSPWFIATRKRALLVAADVDEHVRTFDDPSWAALHPIAFAEFGAYLVRHRLLTVVEGFELPRRRAG